MTRGEKQKIDPAVRQKLEQRRESGMRVQATLDPQSYAARYWLRVDKSGGPDACWPWIGPLNWAGYGTFYTGGWPYQEHAHRTALRLSGVEPPRGGPRHGVVDHMCRNRACCNPKHLRVTTQRVNTLENNSGVSAINASKTHCLRGHPLSGDNLRVIWVRDPRGAGIKHQRRICIECYSTRSERKRAA